MNEIEVMEVKRLLRLVIAFCPSVTDAGVKALRRVETIPRSAMTRRMVRECLVAGLNDVNSTLTERSTQDIQAALMLMDKPEQEQARTRVMRFRASPSEQQEIERLAGKHNLDISSFLREAAMKYQHPNVSLDYDEDSVFVTLPGGVLIRINIDGLMWVECNTSNRQADGYVHLANELAMVGRVLLDAIREQS